MRVKANNTTRIVPGGYDFMAHISHQLSSCAAKMDIIAQLMAEQYPLSEPIHQEAHGTLAILSKQVLYIGRITSLLNQAAGFEASLLCRPVNMGTLIDEVITSYRLQPLNNAIITCYPGKSLFVWGDSGSLQVVLDNLIGNALKYSEPHAPVIVSIEECKHRVDKDAGQMLISVANSGSFIMPQEQEKIFDKFYRSLNNDKPGQGLGLYLAKYLVEAHDGQLSVESSPNDGTTFWFTLPLIDRSRGSLADPES